MEYLVHPNHRSALDRDEEHVLEALFVADSLADHLSKSNATTLRALLSLGLLSQHSFLIYSHAEEKEPLMLVPYLLTFVAAFLGTLFRVVGLIKVSTYIRACRRPSCQLFGCVPECRVSADTTCANRRVIGLDTSWYQTSHMMRPFGRIPGKRVRISPSIKARIKTERVEQLWV